MTDQPDKMPVTIPLGRAALCLDCDSIWQLNGRKACPNCGSPQYWSLATGLNRGENRPNSAEEDEAEGEG